MSTRVLERKLSVKELSETWGWTPKRIWTLVRANEIPHLRIGDAVFFELSALEAWLRSKERGQAIEPNPEAAGRRAASRASLGLPPTPRAGFG
jgi:hypothetical protein